MKTHERARHLAEAMAHFPWLAGGTARDLIELVRLELGHAEILDGFQAFGSGQAWALPPRNLLLVMSGATPHAALQALVRALLLGGPVRGKLPTGGLPEAAHFCELLPSALRDRVELREELTDGWLEEAETVVAFGRDESLAALRKRLRPDQRFLGHGSRISFGVIGDDPDYASIPAAARDASLFDQRGCLSPHVFFVQEMGPRTAHEYAARLARAMNEYARHAPRQYLALSEHAAIRELRQNTAFRAANGQRVALWSSAGDTSWTVICEGSDLFPETPLNRVIFVQPRPSDLALTLAPLRSWISTVGCWPLTANFAQEAATWGASRVCQIGKMQEPSPFWHQDGQPQLSALVRWVDYEQPA